jgi:hypothetical protein
MGMGTGKTMRMGMEKAMRICDGKGDEDGDEPDDKDCEVSVSKVPEASNERKIANAHTGLRPDLPRCS